MSQFYIFALYGIVLLGLEQFMLNYQAQELVETATQMIALAQARDAERITEFSRNVTELQKQLDLEREYFHDALRNMYKHNFGIRGLEKEGYFELQESFSGLSVSEAQDLIKQFMLEIVDDDLKRLPEPIEFESKIGHAVRKFEETDGHNCDIVWEAVDSEMDTEERKINLIMKFTEHQNLIGIDQSNEIVLSHLLSTAASSPKVLKMVEDLKKISKFHLREWMILGEMWLRKRKIKDIDVRDVRCFAERMLLREKLSPFDELVEKPGSIGDADIENSCGVNYQTIQLQALADLLLRPIPISYPFLGKRQLVHHLRYQLNLRNRELRTAMMWNLCHPAVRKLHLIVTNDNERKKAEQLRKTHPYQVVIGDISVDVMDDKAVEKGINDYVNGLTEGTAVVVANSDVLLGEGWSKLSSEFLAERLLVFQRHELSERQITNPDVICDKELNEGAPPYDAIAFRTPFLIKDNNDVDANTCSLGSGVAMSNPCITQRIYHYHISQFRPLLPHGQITTIFTKFTNKCQAGGGITQF